MFLLKQVFTATENMLTDKKNVIITAVVLVLIVTAVGSFFAGVSFGKGKNTRGNFSNDGNFQGKINQGSGAGMISGEVIGIAGDNIIISQGDGTERKINISEAVVTITEIVNKSIDDLAVGQSVIVNGSNDSDDNFSATIVQIRSEEDMPASAQNRQPQDGVPAAR